MTFKKNYILSNQKNKSSKTKLLYLLVKTESKNKYSVYEMIPVSFSSRNNLVLPFFFDGVTSVILSKSFRLSLRRLIRAVNRNDKTELS